MFAIAIFDSKANELILCRDRFGIKPLYFVKTGEDIIFSSEIKAILKSGLVEAKFNSGVIGEYLMYRHVLEPNTFFEGIHQVKSATIITFQADGEQVEELYWKLPNTISEAELSEKELLSELEEKLIETVEKWAVSDVPLGSFLSGGVDSSFVSAVLSRSRPEMKTFTIGFAEGGYNEFEHAKVVANHIGSDHFELHEDLESYQKHWDDLIAFKDAPLAVPNEVPLALMCRELKNHFTVVMSGEGADELFGGYGRIFQSPFDFEQSGQASFVEYFLERYRYVDESFVSKYFVSQEKNVERSAFEILKSSSSNQDFVYRFFHLLHIKGLLARVDMTSMSASVEARPPFLDHELIEYVYGNIPNSMKVKWKAESSVSEAQRSTADVYSEELDVPKFPLKKIAERYLPCGIVYRKKMGFPVPLDPWYDELERIALQELEGVECLQGIDVNEFLLELAQQKRPGQLLWMVLNLARFENKYFKKSWVW